jgi:anti-sigma factor (TIGR02949 family)
MTSPHPIACEEALRVLAEYLDGELSDLEQYEVRHHLDACRSCYSRAEFERRLRAQLAALGRPPVPSEFEGRVRALISRFALRPESVTTED